MIISGNFICQIDNANAVTTSRSEANLAPRTNTRDQRIMPLQLTIHIEASSSAAFGTDNTSAINSNYPSTHTSRSNDRIHCFVQLPADVANSLNTIEPYAPLVILQVRHARTSRQVYVAWDGGTTSPSQLGIHQRFAAALDFHNGDSVGATIVERVVSTPRSDHDTALRSAVVKPLL